MGQLVVFDADTGSLNFPGSYRFISFCASCEIASVALKQSRQALRQIFLGNIAQADALSPFCRDLFESYGITQVWHGGSFQVCPDPSVALLQITFPFQGKRMTHRGKTDASHSFPQHPDSLPPSCPPSIKNDDTGFSFLLNSLKPLTFFRLWPGAPLADAVGIFDDKSNVLYLFQCYLPNSSAHSTRYHSFRGYEVWATKFPHFTFQYCLVSLSSEIEKIGWPRDLTEVQQRFPDRFLNPYLLGLSLDASPPSSPDGSGVSVAAAVSASPAQVDEKLFPNRSITTTSSCMCLSEMKVIKRSRSVFCFLCSWSCISF